VPVTSPSATPQEFPLPGYVEALQRWVHPQDKDGAVYTMSEPAAQHALTRILHARRRAKYNLQGLVAGWCARGSDGRNAHSARSAGRWKFPCHAWPAFVPMIQAAFGTPIRALVNRSIFALDLEASEAAISQRTRAVLVNLPSNPTGSIYSGASLRALAHRLGAASP